MKATEQYFSVVLFIMLYKVVLTFESVDEILKWDHSSGSSLAILFDCIVCFSTLFKTSIYKVFIILSRFTCRGLFERHKLLFSFQMCSKILEAAGKLNMDEYNFFLRGGVVSCNNNNN